jgi:hypothetical protein
MAFSALNSLQLYSARHGFRPVEEIAELADKPTGFGDVARGVFAWSFRVTRLPVLTKAERRTTPNTMLPMH